MTRHGPGSTCRPEQRRTRAATQKSRRRWRLEPHRRGRVVATDRRPARRKASKSRNGRSLAGPGSRRTADRGAVEECRARGSSARRSRRRRPRPSARRRRDGLRGPVAPRASSGPAPPCRRSRQEPWPGRRQRLPPWRSRDRISRRETRERADDWAGLAVPLVRQGTPTRWRRPGIGALSHVRDFAQTTQLRSDLRLARASRLLRPASLVALCGLLLSPGLWLGPSFDGSVYTLAGVVIDQGRMPYTNLFDNKPPGLYLLNAAGEIVLPWLDPWIVTWVLTLAFPAATVLVVDLLLRRRLPPAGSYVMAALCAVGIAAPPTAYGGGLTASF